MSTYRQLTYLVLDEIKGVSDDFTYTEDHIIFRGDWDECTNYIEQRVPDDAYTIAPDN